MATVPAARRHQQRHHSSPDLSELVTSACNQQNQFRRGLPPVTIPAATKQSSAIVSPIDTCAQNYDQQETTSLRSQLTPVKEPTSPVTPTSAGAEIRDMAANLPVYGMSSVGAIPIRASSSLLSQSNSFEFSPNSLSSSPGMEHIPRMTPLPSPMVHGGSPGPWTRFRSRSVSRPTSRSSLSVFNSGESVFVTSTGEPLSQALAVQSQRKTYQGLAATVPHHSTVHTVGEISLEVPGAKMRNGATPIEPTTLAITPEPEATTGMKREECLARTYRHRATSIESNAESSPSPAGGLSSSSSISSAETAATTVSADERDFRLVRKARLADFEAHSVPGNEIKRWRGLRLLGQGTFSKVMLATSEEVSDQAMDLTPTEDDGSEEEKDRGLNPKYLVAVKIVENSAAGGASRERVESSLKRELDILKTVDHPSLVQLKAYSIQPSRALLVLPYCPGGDLFDLASEHRELLTPPLIRRLFAELVGAVQYLHSNGIVHRDVKLENVLMNLTPAQVANIPTRPFDYPHPIITLTDLGLSKRVDFSADPLLTTRCGSEDYASPELLMGQPYDGRQTDAWALGVLLYALLEGRLPFDPLPGAGNKMRSRTAHRIARCEWKWLKIADPEQYDPELEGGKGIVDGLLKRVRHRIGLDVVAADPWVSEAIEVELKRMDEV